MFEIVQSLHEYIDVTAYATGEVEGLVTTATGSLQTDFLAYMPIILAVAVIIFGTMLAWKLVKRFIGGR